MGTGSVSPNVPNGARFSNRASLRGDGCGLSERPTMRLPEKPAPCVRRPALALARTRAEPGARLVAESGELEVMPEGCNDLLERINYLLGQIGQPDAFINGTSINVSGASISYTRFDGLVLQIAPTDHESIELRAGYDGEIAAKFRDRQTLSATEQSVPAIAARLNRGEYDASGAAD